MLNVKKLLIKVLTNIPRIEKKGDWLCLKAGTAVICARQLNLTPTAAATSYNESVLLPYTFTSYQDYFPVLAANSRNEINVLNYAAIRTNASTVTAHIYASNTTTRAFVLLVFGIIGGVTHNIFRPFILERGWAVC